VGKTIIKIVNIKQNATVYRLTAGNSVKQRYCSRPEILPRLVLLFKTKSH